MRLHHAGMGKTTTAIATTICNDTGYGLLSREITVLVDDSEKERGLVISQREMEFEITRPVYNEIQMSGQERRRQRRKQDRKK